jgi:hypothetical protein
MQFDFGMTTPKALANFEPIYEAVSAVKRFLAHSDHDAAASAFALLLFCSLT